MSISSVEKKRVGILVASTDFPPDRNGISTIAGELAVGLTRFNHPLMLVVPQFEGYQDFDKQYSYRAHRTIGYEWGYARFFPFAAAMIGVLLRERPKKIFALSIAYSGLFAWIFSGILKIDYVLYAYGYEFEKVKTHPLLKKIYLKIYENAKSTICCSREVRQKLIRFGVSPGKIEVLYPGVDTTRYAKKEIPEDFVDRFNLKSKRILFTAGRLVERKGQDQVLRALPQLIQKFPDLVYVMAGCGEFRDTLEALAESLSITSHVRFVGRLNDEDLISLYNACEVFIMPSREIEKTGHVEGFGIVYLEANACGKPVIGGRSGGVVEAIQDGVTGFLVNPLSLEEIVEKVAYLFECPDESRKMGEAGLRRVLESFSWKQYVQSSYNLIMKPEESS